MQPSPVGAQQTQPMVGPQGQRQQQPTQTEVLAYNQMASMGKSYTVYYVVGGIAAAAALWFFFFRTPSRGVRGVRGLGQPSRLKTLQDNVPSDYGLEVD